MVLPLFVLVFLIACVIAYWRTLWVGKKYRVPVALCSLLNTGSMIGIAMLFGNVWQVRSWQSFGLLTVPAAGYLLTEWWNVRLKQQQEDSLEKPKEL